MGEMEEGLERGGVLTPFDEAEVRGIHAGLATELDQTPLPLLTKAADDGSEEERVLAAARASWHEERGYDDRMTSPSDDVSMANEAYPLE
jgi:hypothetical protein